MFKIKGSIKQPEIPQSPVRALKIVRRTKGDRIFENAYKEQQKVIVPLSKVR